MNITVAAYFADVPGKPSRVLDYLPLIVASRVALERTNPGARYVVLTDDETAPVIEPHAEVWITTMPADRPLLWRLLWSQAEFVRDIRNHADLVCLPDVDCFANRDLTDSIPADVGLAITHKGQKFNKRINNLAYCRDLDLAWWFLTRAGKILQSWPIEAQEWWGDQEAWGAALGTGIQGLGTYVAYVPLVEVSRDEAGEATFIATPVADRSIHVYPCRTHNCSLADDGVMRPHHMDAYFVHLKGSRKQHVDKFMAERFGSDDQLL